MPPDPRRIAAAATLLFATLRVGALRPTVPGPGHPTCDSLFADLQRDTLRDLKGVLVERHGRVLAEAYFNGDDSTTLHDIRSATKSITSTLVGIALDRGLIRGVDQSIVDLLPLDRAVYGRITLRD